MHASENQKLEKLVEVGRSLLHEHKPDVAHANFARWDKDVADWLDEKYPSTGMSAEWSAQGASSLCWGNRCSNDQNDWMKFRTVVQSRMTWIANTMKKVDETPIASDRVETATSDILSAEVKTAPPTLLVVAASPHDQDRLRLGAEIRDIREALRRSNNRENWRIESNEAVTVDDLRRALLDFRPTILHFSGHGGGDQGLCFEGPTGDTHLSGAVPLANLLHHFKDTLKCVVLNSCYSQAQADVIRDEVDYVIGMRGEVNDTSAAKFAVGFYDAIFAGTDFRTAFDLGCTALELNNLDDADVPVFIPGSRIDIPKLAYLPIIPDIETLILAFLNTPYAERAKFTTIGESLSQKMINHYGDRILRTCDRVKVQAMDKISVDQWRVLCQVWQGSKSMEGTFYVCIRGRIILLEWEASVGYWSLPFKTYVALGSDEPIVARVTAELDDYYNFDFKDKEHAFQSISMETRNLESLHAYVHRFSEAGRELIAVLSDGNKHDITVEIRNRGRPAESTLIVKLVSQSWL